MRCVRGTALFTTAVVVIGLLALNWRAQIQTQQRIDALTATLAARDAAPASDPRVPVVAVTASMPRELDKFKLPPYVIGAPDQLTIEVVVKDPKTGALDRLPTQPISGQFLVRPDGTVGLGSWGSVPVTGLTLEKASAAVRNHIAKQADQVPPEHLVVAVDLMACHSKFFYVITNMTGRGGEELQQFPLTGNETVLDAISKVNSLPEATGERNVRISRRTGKPNGPRHDLPVDWKGITKHGLTHTNYQILPDDRIYVMRAAN